MINDIQILHLIPNDNVFIDSAYNIFETVAPLCNTFVLPSLSKKLKYIKKTPIKFINPFSFRNPFFIRSLEKYDFIVFHSLTLFDQQLLANANLDLPFVWIGYGSDYYDLIYDDPHILYQEKTKNIVKNLTPNETPVITKIIRLFEQRAFYTNLNKKAIVEKIDFFSPVLENEYKMVASKFGPAFPTYTAWNYMNSARYFNENVKYYSPNGNNILIGNSASPTNNHIDIFENLKDQNLGNSKIICPLSYGNSYYADIVNNIGKSYFSERFLGLDTIMPYKEYFELISTCSNVIMNHHRQEGYGNIVTMLYVGANVFLNKINPVYSFLKEKGMKVFTIEELLNSPDLLNSHLSEGDIEQNRQILISIYGDEAILNKTEMLIRKVIS